MDVLCLMYMCLWFRNWRCSL